MDEVTDGFEARVRSLLRDEAGTRLAANQPTQPSFSSAGRSGIRGGRILRSVVIAAFVVALAVTSIVLATRGSGPTPAHVGHKTTRPSPVIARTASLTCDKSAQPVKQHGEIDAAGFQLSASLSGDPTVRPELTETATLSFEGTKLASASLGSVSGWIQVGTPNGALCIARFPGSSAATALVGLYDGGAHGPESVQVIYPTAGGRYAATVIVFDDESLRTLAQSGGRLIFFGADPRLSYKWTDFADSGSPILIQSFEDGHLVDVTSRYLALVRQDAATWLQLAETSQARNAGFPPAQDGEYSAWAADECRLEPTHEVWTALDQLAAEGKLTQGTLSGTTFVAQLEQVLVSDGICVAPS